MAEDGRNHEINEHNLWWSTSMGVIHKYASGQFNVLDSGRGFSGWFPSTRWPDDAVRLMLADGA